MAEQSTIQKNNPSRTQKNGAVFPSESEIFIRQKDFFLPSQAEEAPVTVVGAGGIGSWTALILAKLGITRLSVYDSDSVEWHNVPSQFYRAADVGKPKVNALRDALRNNTPIQEVTARHEIFNGPEMNGIFIIAVDSMEERARLCNSFQNELLRGWQGTIIDARMGGEQLEVYVCHTPAQWVSTLVPPGMVDKDPCTGRSIVYNTSAIGGIIASLVKKLILKESCPRQIIFDLKTYLFIASS